MCVCVWGSEIVETVSQCIWYQLMFSVGVCNGVLRKGNGVVNAYGEGEGDDRGCELVWCHC